MTTHNLSAVLALAMLAGSLAGCGVASPPASASQDPTSPRQTAAPPGYAAAAEAALAEKFKGITTDGKVVPGLFAIKRTGVSTRPIKDAAEAFIASLNAPQKAKALYPVDSIEWRRWSNIHRYPREGVSFSEMDAAQREKGLALLKASLSLKGFENARDIMRLNETIAEMTGRREEYGEGLYWFTIMGTPSATEPWGWQLDGHHLIINYFILKDQIVMTPAFMGSEPVYAESGKYAGTRVFAEEERAGLALIRALTPEQRNKAVISQDLPREIFTAAFRDNFELRYEGIRAQDLSKAQQALLLKLVETYVGNIRPGHARVRMEEVKQHLAETWFAWMGGVEEDGVFYYRVHSPVILIEFDHQRGVALRNDKPTRNHIHTVVRTPNGNDYGKDLLRQHHEQFDHSKPGSHTHAGQSGAAKKRN
jgi:predicted small lipoprotein YifL